MRRLLATLALCTSLLPAHAEGVKTPCGSFIAPDGLQVLDRDDKPDAKTGKPSGMVVFSRANDLPRAVFIVVCSYVEPDAAKPFDAQDAAVRMGNPFDRKLTRDAAKPQVVGGVDGARFEGTLPNGLRAISYTADRGGYRLVVLLKGPANSPYKELADQFAKGIEGFAWALPAADGAASAPQ